MGKGDAGVEQWSLGSPEVKGEKKVGQLGWTVQASWIGLSGKLARGRLSLGRGGAPPWQEGVAMAQESALPAPLAPDPRALHDPDQAAPALSLG